LTTEHQRRVRELFDAALDQPAELRQEFLAGACQGDKQLLDTVGQLLAANQRAAGVLDTPVWQRHEPKASPNMPGSFIGPYKILRALGEGGMGIVYQAVRADEVFQRICAIKVISPDIAGGWLGERFRQERQILARLDHVNIARIVDGGSTPEGLPYFVMDFVDGPAINKFCAEHSLGVRPRLALFQQVCAAVQYLHQNGVIHGDLKPPNILVGADGLIKLVDFGIASALSGAETQDQSKALPLMTPGYASPEQMQGKPLTPASDVYSLGVVLYELLTGTRPFAVASRSRDEMLEAITKEPPLPPSAATKWEIGPALKGELDSVVLRAIDRDPQRRYSTVAALGADIAAYLEDRPVSTRKGGFAYRSQRFLRRNGRAAAAAVLIAGLLASTTWEGLELRKRIQVSNQLQEQVRQLQNELDEEMRQHKAELMNPQTAEAARKLLASPEFRENQLREINNLSDAYRTKFAESVRLWPGMTRTRRDLLDHADQYLHQAEPLVRDDPRAPEQLAGAWLWLANLEGNPSTVNLHDRVGARASINEARRLLEKSQSASARLLEQVKSAARAIEPEKH
jgi:serine/threonine protein kinase